MCGLLFVAPGSTWLIPWLAEDKEKQMGFHGVSGGATTARDVIGAAGGTGQELVGVWFVLRPLLRREEGALRMVWMVLAALIKASG